MSGIPSQVKEANDRADAALSGVQAPEPVAQPTPSPAPAPEAPPAPQAAPPSAIPSDPGQPTPAQSPTPLPVNTAQPAHQAGQQPVDQTELARIQKSFGVLQGKYDAEVPRLAKENRQLFEQNMKLMEQLNQQQAPAAPPPAPVSPSPEVTYERLVEIYGEDQVDSYGEDFLRNNLKFAREGVSQELEGIRQELAAKDQQYEQSTAMVFNSMLQMQVPEISVYNTDPGFNSWLSQPLSDYSPITRLTGLQEAYSSQDIPAIARFVEAYKTELSQTPLDGDVPVTPSIESQVNLTGGPAAPPPDNSQKKTYTGAEYAKLSESIAIGRITGEDRTRLEQELNLAVAEGRVR